MRKGSPRSAATGRWGFRYVEIGSLLDAKGTPAAILAARLEALNAEIARCREQQAAILGLLRAGAAARAHPGDGQRNRSPSCARRPVRRRYESVARRVRAHGARPIQDFLESLGIPAAEIARIRRGSRAGRRSR